MFSRKGTNLVVGHIASGGCGKYAMTGTSCLVLLAVMFFFSGCASMSFEEALVKAERGDNRAKCIVARKYLQDKVIDKTSIVYECLGDLCTKYGKYDEEVLGLFQEYMKALCHIKIVDGYIRKDNSYSIDSRKHEQLETAEKNLALAFKIAKDLRRMYLPGSSGVSEKVFDYYDQGRSSKYAKSVLKNIDNYVDKYSETVKFAQYAAKSLEENELLKLERQEAQKLAESVAISIFQITETASVIDLKSINPSKTQSKIEHYIGILNHENATREDKYCRALLMLAADSPSEQENGIHILQALAEEKHRESCEILGVFYQFGLRNILEKDVKKANSLYEQLK